MDRIRQFARKVNNWVSTYRLTIWTGFALTALMALSFWGLYAFTDYSVSRARTTKSELFQRDLSELANHFDTDERFVLERNIGRLVSPTRPLNPLLLPRQYYISLPAIRSKAIPRQPPRNCFVNLTPTTTGVPSSDMVDRFCSYFVENHALGDYAFLNFELNDNSVVPLRPGDISLAADSLEIQLALNGVSTRWQLVIQSAGQDAQGRYELTAFRRKSNGVTERDRRLEGWAFSVRQANGSQKLYVLARLDVKEFLVPTETSVEDAPWPPQGWERAEFSITRYDYSRQGQRPRVTPYSAEGASVLSLPALAATIFAARASLDVNVTRGGALVSTYKIQPTYFTEMAGEDGFIKFVDGDILISSSPLKRAQSVVDTNLELVVTHPGFVVEQGVWRVLIWLLALAAGAIVVVVLFLRRVLRPIFDLTRHARRLAQLGTNGNLLPYEDNKDEIGILARAFNELIRRVRDHIEREIKENAMRAAEEASRREAAVRNREENLNIIGHEIRSPLQALVSLHAPGSESRRYLDRILHALPHLQQGMAAEDAISSRKLDFEPVDMVALMTEIASNAELVDIPNVVYDGEISAVECLIDAEAFEDVVDNVLRNAARHRTPGTDIFVTVRREDGSVSINVTNSGPHIHQDLLDRIFEYGFSTATKKDGHGNGLGLWIARNYLGKMRGAIVARNLPNSEVSFEILLPEYLSASQDITSV